MATSDPRAVQARLFGSHAPLPEEQERVVEAREKEVWVVAAAGSGKTRSLVERLARRVLDEPASADCTVAFTFTRKAAQEMLGRLREEIARRGPRAVVRDVDRLSVGTIDSFCFQALRRHAAEAGLDPRFQLLEEIETRALEERVARQVITAAVREEESSRALASWLLRYEEHELASFLVEAGSALRHAGEPEELLEKWRQGEGRTFESYCRDFERKKVDLQHAELARIRPALERAAEHPSRDESDHAAIRAALQRLAGGTWDFEAWKEIRDALHANRGPRAQREGFMISRAVAWEFLDMKRRPWSAVKDLVLGAADPQLYGALSAFVPLLRAYLGAYAEAKRRMLPQRLDYPDVLMEVITLAERSPTFRDWCREELQELLVDELQDINGLQSRLIGTLGLAGRVFGVGDPMQSIYRFRHAEVRLFVERIERAQADGAGIAVHTLRTNYRSVPGIVDFANAVFPILTREEPGLFRSLASRKAASGFEAPPVEFHVLAPPEDAEAMDAERRRVAEARAVARRLQELMGTGMKVTARQGPGEPPVERPLEWRDIAILFRARVAIPTYAKVLADEGIPSETLHSSLLLESIEGRDLISLLWVLLNPRQDVALAAVLRSPFVDLSDDGLLVLGRALQHERQRGGGECALFDIVNQPATRAKLEVEDRVRLTAFLARLDPSRDGVLTEGASTLLRRWLDDTGYLAREGARRPGDQIAANLDAFLDFCRRIEPSRGDLPGLLERLRLISEAEEGPGEGAARAARGVQLMTIHHSKGLEFPVVVIAQMDRAWNTSGKTRSPVMLRFGGSERHLQMALRLGATFGDPQEHHGWAEFFLSLEEERDNRLEEVRLFYVAATRAKDRLIMIGTQGQGRGDSQWRDSYAGWLDGALEELARGGVDVETLARRVERPAVAERGDRAAAAAVRSLRQRFPEEIQAAAPLALEPPPSEEDRERARAWVERAGKLSKRPHLAPRDIDVSDMRYALLCPWSYHYKSYFDELARLAPREFAGEERGGRERGSRIHRFMERRNERVPLEDELTRALADEVLEPRDAELVRAWTSRPAIAAALSEIGAAAHEGLLWKEVPFEWLVGGPAGTRISGQIDALVTLADGTRRVIDYKTDLDESGHELYDQQTGLYAAAVERAGLGKVTGRRLIYLQLGFVRDFDWKEADAAEMEQKALKTLRLLGLGNELDAPGCGRCPACALRAGR